MGRSYAGVLGLIAFATSLAHGTLHAQEPHDMLLTASLCLAMFTAIGCVAGRLGAWIVEESVQAQIAEQLREEE